MNYFIHCFKNYANFSGRARRKEYWMFVLFTIIFLILISILDGLLGTSYTFNYPLGGKEIPMSFGYISIAFYLAIIIPGIAVSVRRFHDIGKSGWWYFVSMIPCVGPFIGIYFMAKAGDIGENLYGPDPKAY
jgi:uncharacterized membrane protein YhaH (DUF805 family)